MSRSIKHLAAAACLMFASSALGEDLFRVVAVGTNDTVEVGGDSLPEILENIGDLTGDFAVLDGRAFVAIPEP